MSNERITKAASSIVEQLYAAETAIDLALEAAANLNATMAKARLEARVAATVGQDAIDSVTGSLSRLADARRDMVGAHKHLDTVRSELGLPEQGFGGGMLKPIGRAMFHVVRGRAA